MPEVVPFHWARGTFTDIEKPPYATDWEGWYGSTTVPRFARSW
jgi:hypothetical protein